jgi:flap endonuclease-1
LEKRRERREKARVKMEDALKFGDLVGAERYAKQLERVTSTHTEEVKYLLELLGVPVIQVSFTPF